MNGKKASIGDLISVRAHPTVVRLEHLSAPDANWLTESFVLTNEVKQHLLLLQRIVARGRGCGIFVIGHYGAGKSHFLAYLAREIENGRLLTDAPSVSALSLLNYSATNRLEDIISEHFDLPTGTGDRRTDWTQRLSNQTHGLVLLLDELSEFLRSKADIQAFNEDIRFLQFLAEWAQDKPFWIIAAMQEGIEHTGELEYSLYRKIKDRYPLRLLLTPAHVHTLIADSILIKREGYTAAVEKLIQTWREALPGAGVDYQQLLAIYPLHPATLSLLEEVRDRFSQARGVVDFLVTRLRGDPTRDIEPFLGRPWGELITPDVIVEHFRDLFEVQPEYLPLAQQVFPWYDKHLQTLFEKPALRRLAGRLLNLLVLVYLSPARERLNSAEALSWLAFSVARLDPQRNRRVIERVLTILAEQGRFVASKQGGYALNLRDDGNAALERQLKREMTELQGRDETILETLVELLPREGINPFQLPREQWQHRQVDWHFHPRVFHLWFGNDAPDKAPTEPALCLRLPWGDTAPAPRLYTLIPAPLKVSEDFVELAALARLAERPLAPEIVKQVASRLKSRLAGFATAMRNAWAQATLVTPEGNRETTPPVRTDKGFNAWLDDLAVWMLRRIYPSFERFAPSYGPLPKEAWLRYVHLASEDDPLALAVDEYVSLVQESYLVPMGLLRRQGKHTQPRANLERHELVALLTPLIEHGVSPKTLYQHLAEPIYGLVEDQVSALLLFLLLQGEIEILKGKHAYRDYFETLPHPLHYDRIVPGHALDQDALQALQQLCEAANLKAPQVGSALSQRRVAQQLVTYGQERVLAHETLRARLRDTGQGKDLLKLVDEQIDTWRTLEQGGNALQGFELLRFQAGAISTFLEREQRLNKLAERLPQLLAEWKWFQHMVQHPHLDAPVATDLRKTLTSLGEPPSLDRPAELESWLRTINEAYAAYKRDYQEHHDHWWQELGTNPLWSWQPPAIARSRHLALSETLQTFDECRQKLAAQRCHGLTNLDYQPLCNCGFDGESTPVLGLLERCESSQQTIEQQIRGYFQQDRVKARIQSWRSQGLEVNEELLAYLEGDRDAPEVTDLSMLDEHLAGLELVTEIDVGPMLELLTRRSWAPEGLLEALTGQLRSYGARQIRFSPPEIAAHVPEPIAVWCVEQCLRQGTPLPKGLRGQSFATISDALQPGWISAQALTRLIGLGLNDTLINRVLGWLIDGHLPLPPAQVPAENPVAAIRELLQPSHVNSAEQFVEISEALYRHHHRLMRLTPDTWLKRLNSLAGTFHPDLPALVELLTDFEDAQWLILDCLGSALVRPLSGYLESLFNDWQTPTLHFAITSPDSSTEGCYRAMLEAGIQHSFEKINVIDRLIHDNFRPFDEVIALAHTQLDIACKPIRKKLDPGRKLLIFADHGFRISADGRRYEHSGGSTIERLVPLWSFESFQVLN